MSCSTRDSLYFITVIFTRTGCHYVDPRSYLDISQWWCLDISLWLCLDNSQWWCLDISVWLCLDSSQWWCLDMSVFWCETWIFLWNSELFIWPYTFILFYNNTIQYNSVQFMIVFLLLFFFLWVKETPIKVKGDYSHESHLLWVVAKMKNIKNKIK